MLHPPVLRRRFWPTCFPNTPVVDVLAFLDRSHRPVMEVALPNPPSPAPCVRFVLDEICILYRVSIANQAFWHPISPGAELFPLLWTVSWHGPPTRILSSSTRISSAAPGAVLHWCSVACVLRASVSSASCVQLVCDVRAATLRIGSRTQLYGIFINSESCTCSLDNWCWQCPRY